jgi:hypothetical protein
MTIYREGYQKGLQRNWKQKDVEIIRGAIKDCQDMGWLYLKQYFQGQLDAYNDRQEVYKG